MSDVVRFAVVGCGVIGRVHAEVLAAGRHGTSVSVLVDPDPRAACAVAEEVVVPLGGVPPAVVGSLGEALARRDVDAVVLCVPTGARASLAVEVLRAGRHLVVEKPLEAGVGAARRIADAATARPGAVASVISQHRFDPSSVAVHEAVLAGRLGRLTSAVASVPWWRGQAYYDSADWRGTRGADGGGALLNQGVHTLDLLLWLMGRPVEVSARTALLVHERIEVEDAVAAVVVFESGALATVHATTAAYPGLGARLQVMGDRGTAVLEGDRLVYLHSADHPSAAGSGQVRDRGLGGGGNQVAAPVPEPEQGPVGRPVSPLFAGHDRQYEDVLDAVRTGRPPGVTVADGLLALATAHAVYESARTGAAVSVDDVLHARAPVG